MTNTTSKNGLAEREVESLIARLDSAHGRWDLWRVMGNEAWVVKVTDHTGRRTKTVNRPTLVQALADAVDVAFLPVVPRRPRPATYEVRKSGPRHWKVWESGTLVTRKIDTKREALELADRLNEKRRNDISQWDTEYAAMVAAGAADRDFEWSDFGAP